MKIEDLRINQEVYIDGEKRVIRALNKYNDVYVEGHSVSVDVKFISLKPPEKPIRFYEYKGLYLWYSDDGRSTMKGAKINPKEDKGNSVNISLYMKLNRWIDVLNGEVVKRSWDR